jgi:hypothetical protein
MFAKCFFFDCHCVHSAAASSRLGGSWYARLGRRGRVHALPAAQPREPHGPGLMVQQVLYIVIVGTGVQIVHFEME